MSNLYHDSEEVISKLKSGEIPERSIIRVQWPSGNSEAVRFHWWNAKRNVMLGCSMGWDNSALDDYDLSRGVVSLVELAPALTSKEPS